MANIKSTTDHYAHILHAIAAGKDIQWQSPGGNWVYIGPRESLRDISNDTYHSSRFRVKPNVITIHSVEVPEPLREMPPPGTEVFWPSFGPNSDEKHTESCYSHYLPTTVATLLRQGLLHSTQEAASIHALALISFTETPVEKG